MTLILGCIEVASYRERQSVQVEFCGAGSLTQQRAIGVFSIREEVKMTMLD